MGGKVRKPQFAVSLPNRGEAQLLTSPGDTAGQVACGFFVVECGPLKNTAAVFIGAALLLLSVGRSWACGLLASSHRRRPGEAH